MIIIFRELGHKILTNAKMVAEVVLANTKIFGRYLLASLKVLGHILYTAAIVSWAWIMTNPMVATLALSLCIIGLGLYYLRSNTKAHVSLNSDLQQYKQTAKEKATQRDTNIKEMLGSLKQMETEVQNLTALFNSLQTKAEKSTAQLNQLVEYFTTPTLDTYTTKSNITPINAETINTVLNCLKQNEAESHHIDTPETPRIDTFTLSYMDTPYLVLSSSVFNRFTEILGDELAIRAEAMADLLKNGQYDLILGALNNSLDAHLLLQALSKKTDKLEDTTKELQKLILKCSTLLSSKTIDLESMQESTLKDVIQKHFNISADTRFNHRFLSTGSDEFLDKVINTKSKAPYDGFPSPGYIDTMMYELEQEGKQGSLITKFFEEVKRTLDGSMFSTTLSNDPIANATLINKINEYYTSGIDNFKELYEALEKAIPALKRDSMLYKLRKSITNFIPEDHNVSTASLDSEADDTVSFHSTLKPYWDPLTTAEVLANPLPVYPSVPLTTSSLAQHNQDLGGAGIIARDVRSVLSSTGCSS